MRRSRSSDQIGAFTSGYAARFRREKLLAFLEVYVDDSASDMGDQRLFLAGYINRADRWKLFSDAWDEELHAPPSIDYLHMVEANGLRGQFRGWSEAARDEKMRGFARVISHFKPMSFEFSVDRRTYREKVKPASPRGLARPHFISSFAVVAGVANYVASQKVKVPIDFIFDEQDGVSDDLALFFEHMKRNIPRRARALINGHPIFRNDKLVLPLQAADMLAWHVRREHETCEPPETLPMADLLRSDEGHLGSEIPHEMMERWVTQFDEMPAIAQMQSKSQWQAFRREAYRLAALGYIPPYGTHWLNFVHRVTDLVRAIRKRFR